MKTSARVVGTSVLTGAVLSVATTAALAASILVNNPSFEIAPSGGFPFTSGCTAPTGCSYSEGVGEIPDWTNTQFSGEFRPGTQDGNFSAFDTIPNGITVAFANTAAISQTVGATVQVGVIYTLQVDLGWRNDMTTFTGAADLLVNGTQYVATGVTPVQGNWSVFTATYTGRAADAGDLITIQLESTGSFAQQADFDNVILRSSIPEPATWAMMLMCFAGLGFAAYRRARGLNTAPSGASSVGV